MDEALLISPVAEDAHPGASVGAYDDDGSAHIMALGLASVLEPVVRDFDARVEGALKSQSVLTTSIDRLTQGRVRANRVLGFLGERWI